MPLQRYRVSWTNWPGAPGVSTHYLSTSVADYAPIRNFYLAIKDLFPNNLTFSFPTTVDIINEATGQLTGTIATTPGAQVVSAAPANPYAGSAGAVIRWSTAAIQNGNRVVGRTYLVPLNQTQYANDGSLSGTPITTIQTAATTLLAAYADGIKVWSRPFAGTPGNPARAGAYFTALTATVPDLAAVLRSRRI
jgi:hypothetical protein